MPIVFTLIVVLEAAIALAIGTVLIAAFISFHQDLAIAPLPSKNYE